MNSLRNILSKIRNARFIGNIGALGAMQLVNYVLPILIVPYLVLKIGISNVGVIATTVAVATYFQLAIDYGFSLTATREMAKDGYDDNRAAVITSAVFGVKIVISTIFMFVSILMVAGLSFFRKYDLIFLFSVAAAVAQSLFPSWHFQAAERMHFISISNGVPKILAGLSIFFLIKGPEDAWLVQAIFFMGALAALISAIVILRTKFDYRYSFSMAVMKNQLILGYPIFVARIFSGLYKNYNIIALGYLSSPSTVGAYSIAEKIVRSFQMIQNVVGDALYPRFSRAFKGNPAFFKKFVGDYGAWIFSIYGAFSLLIFLASEPISKVMARQAWAEVHVNLAIMSFAFLFGGLNYLYAILGMTSGGFSRNFASCVIKTGVFNIIVATLLSYKFSAIGASFALMLSEAFLLFLVYRESKRLGLI